MLKALEIRVDSTKVYVTGVSDDGDRHDLYQDVRATGSAIHVNLQSAEDIFAEKIRTAKGDADADDGEKADGADVYQADVDASQNARALAETEGVDLHEIDGTGANGKIYITDVEKYIEDRDVEASGVPADADAE